MLQQIQFKAVFAFIIYCINIYTKAVTFIVFNENFRNLDHLPIYQLFSAAPSAAPASCWGPPVAPAQASRSQPQAQAQPSAWQQVSTSRAPKTGVERGLC